MKLLRRLPIRAFAPIAVAVVALGAAVTFQSLPNPDQGLHLTYEPDGEVVITAVDYGSVAQMAGLQVSDAIIYVDGQSVMGASEQAKREIARNPGRWTYIATVARGQVAAEELTMFQVVMGAAFQRAAFPCGNGGTCTLASLEGGPDSWPNVNTHILLGDRPLDPAPIALGLAILLLGWWWVGSGRAGATLRPYALTLPVATAVPLLILPIDRYHSGPATVIASLLVPLAMLPLAIDLVGRVEGRAQRWLAIALAGALAVGSAIAGLIIPTNQGLGQLHYPVEAALVLGPMALLPVAFVYLWRTERGRRRWLIALVGLVLAVGSIQLGNLIPYIDSPYLTVAGISVLPNPSQLYLLHSVLAQGLAFAPMAMLPLVVVTLRRLAGPRRRWLVVAVLVGLAIGLAAATVYLPDTSDMRLWRAVLAGGVAFVPGLFVARPFLRAGSGAAVGSGPTPRALIESLDVAVAAVTPGIACIGLVFAYSIQVWPILVWLVLLLVATRFTLRPLARLASSATRQRDLVVAATEAERARIAADIHDDALQELTMLVRRLDAAGDTDNAEAARVIAARLRAICGDLRLPILDDLGVGPALEWFVDRLDRLGGPVRLEREGEDRRLPNDVELAVYRIAQEALTNAVKHGAPPIVVRYRLRESGLDLEVDDAGPGLAPEAVELADHAGRLGLIGMTQRAGAIGAVLTVGQRPGGGTRVKLVWAPVKESSAVASTAARPRPTPA